MNSGRLLLISLVLVCSGVPAQQRLEMEGTAIIGNKELPKVLYIVPWKSAEKTDLVTPPYRSVLDQALQPIERKSFNRQVEYYNQLYSSSQEQ